MCLYIVTFPGCNFQIILYKEQDEKEETNVFFHFLVPVPFKLCALQIVITKSLSHLTIRRTESFLGIRILRFREYKTCPNLYGKEIAEPGFECSYL